MLCSLISVAVFSVCSVDGTRDEDELCIHEWLKMSSKDGRSAGRRDRHHLISCWHSGKETGREMRTERSRADQQTPDVRIIRGFTCGDSPSEEHLPSEDLLVVFERDVPAHHVVEQDTQGPDGGRAPVVSVVFDPLRGAVHSGSCRAEGSREQEVNDQEQQTHQLTAAIWLRKGGGAGM